MQTIKKVFEGTHASVVPQVWDYVFLAVRARTGAREVGASLVVAVVVRGAGVISMCLAHQARRVKARQDGGGNPHVGHQ